jgi:hypothetical protein
MATPKKPCLHCGVDTVRLNEHFYLKNEVWNQVHSSERGFLCVGCVELRLGRRLNKDDFTSVSINRFHPGVRKSQRLIERLTTFTNAE